MSDDKRFHYESPADSENEINISTDAGGLEISVADEKAVDSYNQTFECYIYLDKEASARLRDYLNECFPVAQKPDEGK